MKIYVGKNLRSLDRIGSAVAHFLKIGESVQIAYGGKERDIIIRFEKRLTKIYNEGVFGAQHYPESGFVIYTPTEFFVSDIKDETIKRTFSLEYSNLWLWIVRHVKDMIGITKTYINNYNARERF